ncbi:MAG: cyclic-di-AMP receptor [Candidatus Izimaplasma sp.]|nr:cyclic-di-AMP receptor [Candidatus Izimaplasma bacterium]
MKLVMAIVSNDDANQVIKKLIKSDFFVTKLATTGGFLKSGNTTVIVGVQNDRLDECIEVISEHSKQRTKLVPNAISSEFGIFSSTPVEVQVGGATIFVMDVEQFIKA